MGQALRQRRAHSQHAHSRMSVPSRIPKQTQSHLYHPATPDTVRDVMRFDGVRSSNSVFQLRAYNRAFSRLSPQAKEQFKQAMYVQAMRTQREGGWAHSP